MIRSIAAALAAFALVSFAAQADDKAAPATETKPVKEEKKMEAKPKVEAKTTEAKPKVEAPAATPAAAPK